MMFISKKNHEAKVAELKRQIADLKDQRHGLCDELNKAMTANGELKRANDDFARGVHDAAEQYMDLERDNNRLHAALAEKEKALSAIVVKPVHDCAKCKVKVFGNYRSCASCAANPKLVDKFEEVQEQPEA